MSLERATHLFDSVGEPRVAAKQIECAMLCGGHEPGRPENPGAWLMAIVRVR